METNNGATQQDELAQQKHRDEDRRRPAFQRIRDEIDSVLEEERADIGGDLRDSSRAAHEPAIASTPWAGRAFWLGVGVGVTAIGAAVAVWKFALP